MQNLALPRVAGYSTGIAHFASIGRGGRASRRRLRLNSRALLAASLLPSSLLLSAVAAAESSSLDPTVGYNYGEIETARHVATGGAQRALASSVGALFVNPANIAKERVYHIAGLAQLWPEARRQSYGVAATDSVGSSSNLAGAAGVTYNFQDPDGVDRTWTDLRVALAYPFSDKFYFGIGGRYLWLRQEGLGPLGVSQASGGTPDENIVKTFSFDAGLTLRPSPELSFALVGTNLSNPSNGFMPTTFAGAIGYGAGILALEADVAFDFTSWDDTKARVMLGAELLFADHYGLRGGYRYDQGADSHGAALGFAYIDRAFLLELGARRAFAREASTTVGIGFTYHLESTGLTPSPGDTF